MLEAIRGPDYALTAAAARAAMELPGPEVTAALCDELPKLPADKQVLLVNTLGYRGDASAGPALLAVASKGADAVRLAAVQNLTHLGYAPALPLLAELSLAGEGNLAAAARTCLGNFPGKDADATILAMLAHKDAKVRSLAVQMIGQRNIAGSTASLLERAAEDAEEIVRLAAFKALRQQAGAAELPALLNVLVKARSPADIQAAEDALIAPLLPAKANPPAGTSSSSRPSTETCRAGPSADVTRKVAALAKAGVLAIEASNENFGDPANGHVKQLRVDYSVNGVKASKTVREGETLTITATVDAAGNRRRHLRGDARGPGRGQAGPAAIAANGRRAQGPPDRFGPPRPTTTPR